jgi:TonB family protein
LASFLGDALVAKKSESIDTRKTRYSQAADALEKYLQLVPNAQEKQTWVEQLESLRFYVASHRTDLFSSKEVTTKARVLAKPEPAYTESARQAQVTGTVVLRAVFASDGTVKHFLVVKGLPFGLTEASVKAARKIKFIPATIDGRPVSMFIQLEYNFDLY